MDASPDPLVEVFRSSRPKPCRERALVLKAMGIAHQIAQFPGTHVLLAPQSQASRALEQFQLYERENRNWPPVYEKIELYPGVGGALAYCAVLIVCYVIELRSSDWLVAGRASAGAIRGGEWWRTVTALTLHADLAHLAGNLFFGALFGALLSHAVGSGVAWLAVLSAGAFGNAFAAFIHPPGHNAIGASTAVFAAVGVLATYQWRRKSEMKQGRLRRWQPLIAGVFMLGYLGMGGQNTDYIAHVTGLLAGGLMGVAVAAWSRNATPGRVLQSVLGAAAIAFVAVSWWFALGT